jgi:hypothetical protein
MHPAADVHCTGLAVVIRIYPIILHMREYGLVERRAHVRTIAKTRTDDMKRTKGSNASYHSDTCGCSQCAGHSAGGRAKADKQDARSTAGGGGSDKDPFRFGAKGLPRTSGG